MAWRPRKDRAVSSRAASQCRWRLLCCRQTLSETLLPLWNVAAGHRILLAVNSAAGRSSLSNLGTVCPSSSGRWRMAMPTSLEEQGELSGCLCVRCSKKGRHHWAPGPAHSR